MQYVIDGATTSFGVIMTAGRWLVSGVAGFIKPGDPPPTMEETTARLQRVREQVHAREKDLWEKMNRHRDLAVEFASKKQKI